jgi:hypothetical protein
MRVYFKGIRHNEYYFMNLDMNDQIVRTNADTASIEPTETHNPF